MRSKENDLEPNKTPYGKNGMSADEIKTPAEKYNNIRAMKT